MPNLDRQLEEAAIAVAVYDALTDASTERSSGPLCGATIEPTAANVLLVGLVATLKVRLADGRLFALLITGPPDIVSEPPTPPAPPTPNGPTLL